MAVIEVARQRYPAVQAVVDGPGSGRAIGHSLPLQLQPLAECVGHRSRLVLSDPLSLVGCEVLNLALDFIQLYEVFERLFGNRALVVRPQVEELAACVRQATGLGHAHRQELLVARVVVADQLATPAVVAVTA